jgi:ribosomal-protein-alanine N-acetyltransferase
MQINGQKKAFIRIRKFSIEDIDKVFEIEKQAFPKTAYSKETLLRYGENLPDSFIVIETEEDIAGYIIYDKTGHIHSTAVKSLHRRRGFGKMLFMHALSNSKKILWLEVRSKNIVAIRFYKRLGMKIIGEIPNYYESDDALVMSLRKERQS